MMQLVHTKVAQPKLRAFRPQVLPLLDNADWGQSQQQINAVVFIPGALFVSVSHQTGQGQWPECRLKVRIRGGDGWARTEARALLVYAGHRPT